MPIWYVRDDEHLDADGAVSVVDAVPMFVMGSRSIRSSSAFDSWLLQRA